MDFIDEVTIEVRGGSGGNGCVSFRREKFIPFGGPDGGNGGRGGDVVFVASNSSTTLVEFSFRKHLHASNGSSGSGSNRSGASGDDIVASIPIGTEIYEVDSYGNELLLVDLAEEGSSIVVARGGNGGAGNINFKTSTNKVPRIAKPGDEGELKIIRLKLKILSDIGIIGKPNAGKSTLLSKITNAKPKIADYPFTTLSPNLGVVKVGYEGFVIADIPGLLEGASDGVGLGDRFLKHIERCKALLHLIDATDPDCLNSYKVVRNELSQYSELLLAKPEIIALNKCEMLSERELAKISKSLEKVSGGAKIYKISCITTLGLRELLQDLSNLALSSPRS